MLLLTVGFSLVLLVGSLQLVRRDPPDAALPALVRDLPRETVQIEPVFQRRVRARFPEGISSDSLAAQLRRDGFFLRNDRKSGLAFAYLHQSGFPCVSDWTIFWRPDPQGRANGIGAHFNLDCL